MIIINQSGIKTWRRCPQAFYYKEVECIEPRRKSLPLERGSWLHRLLEAYYKGKDWRKVHSKLTQEYDKLMEEEKEYYGDLPSETARIMEGYIKKYGKLKEEPLAVELDFSSTPVQLAPGVFLKGKIDLILRNEKGTWIVEHKTHKKFPGEEERFINLQTAVYIVAAEALGYKIDGTLWDYIRTKPPTRPRILVRGGVSRANIDTDYDTYLEVLKEAGEDPRQYQEELERAKQNSFYERRYIPKSQRVIDAMVREFVITAREIEKLKMFPYRNLDKFNCRNCGYRSLCRAELLGLDAQFIRRSEYQPIQSTPAPEDIEDIDEELEDL